MSTSVLFQWLLVFICGGYLVYHFRNRRLRKLVNRFNGPYAYPIIGNTHLALGLSSNIIEIGKKFMYQYQYTSPIRAWFFHQPIFFIYDPDNVQQILSNKMLKKGRQFSFFKAAFGNGLLTIDKYKTWKKQRYILNPTFNLKFMGKKYLELHQSIEHKLIQNFDVFANTEQRFDLMQVVYNQQTKNIFNVITKYATEYAETKYKFDFNTLMSSIRKGAGLAIDRICNPLLHPEIINKIFTKLTRGNSLLENTREVLKKILEDRSEEMKKIHADNEDSEIGERSRILIDVLLDPHTSAMYDDRKRVDELITFLETGSITTAINLCFTLLMLAMHQEHQDRVHNEIKSVLGDEEHVTEPQDLDRFIFMEQCVKETLRLFPPTPFIIRFNEEDIALKDDRIIPANAIIVTSILFLHRNEKLYSNPEVWDPDRFLPEELVKRHPYSFIPFSIAPRSCIGDKFAYLSIKLQLITLLRRYRFTTDLQLSDIKLAINPLLSNTTGYRVCIHRRT